MRKVFPVPSPRYSGVRVRLRVRGLGRRVGVRGLVLIHLFPSNNGTKTSRENAAPIGPM